MAFGETNEETLVREFREETGAEIRVGELKWVAEIFFPWGDKPCHQICLYYMVELAADSEPIRGTESNLEFFWVPVSELGKIEVYPTNALELMKKLGEGVQHVVYKET